MSRFTVQLLNVIFSFFFFSLITSSLSFSSDEWSNGQLPLTNQRSNDFHFKPRLASTRNSYGTKLLPSESNYQPVISNLDPIDSNLQPVIATNPQRSNAKQWPDPFDPQPHVPIGTTTSDSLRLPNNNLPIQNLNTRLPISSPKPEQQPDVYPSTTNGNQPTNGYQSVSEGELGSPKPKKEKMTVDEIFLGVFSPNSFNGSWLSDHELMYHDPSNNLVLLNLWNDSISLLVSNTTFVSSTVTVLYISLDFCHPLTPITS